MPRISAVGDSALWAAKGKAVDYATIELWDIGEDSTDYNGLPIEAICLGDVGRAQVSGNKPNGYIVRGAVDYDGSNHTELPTFKGLFLTAPNGVIKNFFLIEGVGYNNAVLNADADNLLIEKFYCKPSVSVGSNQYAFYLYTNSINRVLRKFILDGRNISQTHLIRVGYNRTFEISNYIIFGGGINASGSAGTQSYTSGFSFESSVEDYQISVEKTNAASQDLTGDLVGYTRSELVDPENENFQTKSTSPLAASGIGAFVEESEQTTPILSFSSTISVSQLLNATTFKTINHADELIQAATLTAFNVKSIKISASNKQNQALKALNVKCLMLSTELLQGQQLQAEKSKKIAVSGDIQQSYAMQGFFQNGTTEINQFNATISVTPINSAKFNKNVKQESQKSQSIVLTGQAIKRSALQLNINQATLLAANAYKHVNVNAELQQKLVTSAIFFNAAQPLYLRKFRINGEIVFQRFNGATVKQRFNGALN